jgi:hypothetical protein
MSIWNTISNWVVFMAYFIIKTYAKLQVLFTIPVFGISGIHLHIPPSLYCVCPHSIHLVAVIDRSRNSRHPRNPRISKGATFDFSTDGFFHGIQRQEIHGLYNPIKKCSSKFLSNQINAVVASVHCTLDECLIF